MIDSVASVAKDEPDHVGVVIAPLNVDVAAGATLLVTEPDSATNVPLDDAVEGLYIIVHTLDPLFAILLHDAFEKEDLADLFVEWTLKCRHGVLPLRFLILLVTCQLGVNDSVFGLLDESWRPVQMVSLQLTRPCSAIPKVNVVIRFIIVLFVLQLMAPVVEVGDVLGVD